MIDLSSDKNDPILHAAADGPVDLDQEGTAAAHKAIRDAIQSLSFLDQILQAKRITKADVATHLGLFRHNFDDLSKALQANQFLDGKLEGAYADLRRANAHIRELESQLGKGVTGEALSAAIRKFDDMFCAWYALSGFHYASVEYTPWGLDADFSDELARQDEDPEYLPRKARGDGLAIMKPGVPYAFSGTGHDFFDNGYRLHLADTDRNRAALKELIAAYFPQGHITQFKSTPDRDIYLLRFQVFVPYPDIEAMYAKAIENASIEDKPEDRKEGDSN